MAIRLLYTSTRKHTDVIIEKAIVKMGEEIEYVLHVGDMDADIKATSMTRMNMKAPKGEEHIMADKSFKGFLFTIANQQDFEKNASLFIDHLYRLDDKFRYKSHNLTTMYDYLDYYHILYDIMATKIIENKITHILFTNVPHLGFDTICYQIAKSLGLQTIIITQAHFPNYFFSMFDVEDYGKVPNDYGKAFTPTKIEQNAPTDLFYMKKIKQEAGKTGRLSLKAIVHLVAFLIRKRPSYLWHWTKFYDLLKRTAAIYGELPDWRDPFATYFHEDHLAYFEHILQYEESSYDLDVPFVYFPLHMQPEMTTASLGDAFRDQALAIECLADMLPEGVKIYVKENPKQGAYMRGPLFFHRLKRIPSVVILPSFANTHALTDHAQFIATITGTVGWEALQKGKKVLAFGRAWYHSFPGVFHYHSSLRYREILSFDFVHTDLELALGKLLSRSHQGVIDKGYIEIVEIFDKEKNIETSAETIVGLLRGEIEPTFSI